MMPPPLRAPLGITGHPNRSGNDGTITRFGWKAQNKSITIFAGEAYNVEMGITNEAFPTATEEDPDCQGPISPNRMMSLRTDTTRSRTSISTIPLHILPDWQQFQILMRFTDGPAPDPNSERQREARRKLSSRHRMRPVPHAANADRARDEQRGSAKSAGQLVSRI